jgi:hypothetical protein
MVLSEANGSFRSTFSRFGIATEYFQKCFEERYVGQSRHESGFHRTLDRLFHHRRPDVTSPSTQFVRAKKAVAAAR